jgi:coenzyme F420-0:L-glutamate ligase / coenzyme F420-1:gamma-L-glutamate ligase
MVIPVEAPVKAAAFDFYATLIDALDANDAWLQHGDVLAISSKYAAISQGRVVDMDTVEISEEAQALADRYVMNPRLTELIVQEADHIFGGIIHEFNGVEIGFLLTHKDGIISPNAGLDRSNIPSGKVVLFPADPYQMAAEIRQELHTRLGVDVGVILTDSWLMPGRLGTTGVALATAGFPPVKDERGKADLFGNPMQVTQIGVADSICVCAQMVMGETDEATPLAIVRNTGVQLQETALTQADVSIPWEMCIYVGALTVGLLEDGAPRNTSTERLLRRTVRPK